MEVPECGLSSFPNAFHITNLFDIQKHIAQTPTNLTTPPELEMKCKEHDDYLRVYCNTCQELICRDCTVSPHRNHDYYLVKDIYPIQQQEIESKLKKVKERLRVIASTMNDITDSERQIKKQGDDVKKEIHNRTEQIIEHLKESERWLTSQVDIVIHTKCLFLTKQKEEIKAIVDQISSCEQLVEDSLKYRTPEEVLIMKSNMMKQMETASENANQLGFQSIEKADISFIPQEVSSEIISVGKLDYTYIYNECKALLTTPEVPIAGKKSSVSLNIMTRNKSPFLIPSSLLCCEISSTYNNQSLHCDVIHVQQGNHNVEFTPSTQGRHALYVKIGEVEISGSPFSFHVTPSLHLDSRFMKVFSGLKKPYGTAITTSGYIVVAQYGSHCITVLNNEGNKISSFGTRGTNSGQFTYPRGVAITPDGDILVTDDHRVQKLTSDGQFIASVGSSVFGKGTLQFYTPTGIVFHPETGQIFVADTDNHRIQVLNSDLTFSRSFGKLGSLPNQLNCPYDLALDNEGHLLVLDSWNNCIKKFTTDGQSISRFSSKGAAPGELDWPTGVSIDTNGYIFVTEQENKRISTFDNNGKYVSCFGEQQKFRGPQYITVDSEGHVYVSDTYDDKLYVFM